MNKVSIREFYQGKPLKLKNGEYKTFQQILDCPNSFWNECHDFIQWVFPTRTKSQYCEDAPLLTKEDAIYLDTNHTYMYQAAQKRFIQFLNSQDMTKFNHNHLRITRMFEFYGLVFDAMNYYKDIDVLICSEIYLPNQIVEDNYGMNLVRDNQTFKYWVDAFYSKWE